MYHSKLANPPSVVQAVKVNSLGKWKTALQMVAMSALLLLRNADHILGSHVQGWWGTVHLLACLLPVSCCARMC